MGPFIKKFKHHGLCYIYDVNTNQIVEIDQPVYDIIDQYGENNGGQIDPKLKTQIENARKEYGLFSDFRPKIVSMGVRGADSVKKLHQKYGLNQLLLELTTDCNLNCRYCNTSGKYAPEGAHNNHMTWETCKKAVDFFCARAQSEEEPAISFYGGEPVKRFDLIKKTVHYVKQTHGPGKYHFNLTTNGTLLNKEMIDFFIRNDFLLAVSLDGPESVTDRYRLTRDGKGAFHTIMKNLEFLESYNNDYYSRNVSISGVLAPPFDNIDDILDFFSTNQTLAPLKANGAIRSSLVNTAGTSFIKDFDLESSLEGYKNVFNIFIQRLKAAVLGNRLTDLTIEKNDVHSILRNLAKRPIKKQHECSQPLGACHIGLRRLFVKTGGVFQICERAGDQYTIGHIDTGFDYERIAGYYRKFEEVLSDCRDCWALNHCERCWVHVGNLDQFTGKKKEEFCTSSKQTIETAFNVYTGLLSQ
ncbi:MAG: radical SAM protein, partial [bacterium]|nr:radical SAM protein [bacterium]